MLEGPYLVPALVGAVSFFVFVVTVCPTVPFGDGGELIAAASSLGVAHPPGYPLYTILGWLALKVPLGEPALRMNLMSALFAALACGGVAFLLHRMTGSAVAASSGALGLAFSATFWRVATVAEVYTLHLFFMAVLLGAAAVVGSASRKTARTRGLLVGASVLGLGLAHHPTIVLAVPAAVILAGRRNLERGEGRKGKGLAGILPAVPARWMVVAGLLIAALPVLLGLSLMVRARLDPLSNWGRPETLETLWRHVTAAAYGHLDLGLAGLFRGPAWRQLGGLLSDQFTPWILPLAVLGLAGFPRRNEGRQGRGVRLGVVALMAASAIFGLRYTTEDVEVFYLPTFVGLALAMGLGVGRLLEHPLLVVRRVGLLAALLVPLVPAVNHATSRNLRGMTAAEDYARDILETVPQDGVLFVESDDSFGVLYLKQVLGERPDVTVYDRRGFLFRNLVEEMRVGPGMHVEKEFIRRELGKARPREILFLGWPGYSMPPEYRLEPVGLLNRICRSIDPVREDGPLWAGYHEAAIRDQALRADDGLALAFAATYPLARGERALFEGDRAAADAALEEAGRLGSGIAGIHSYIGTLYGRIGDYGKAIDAFERALAIKPVYVGAWNNLAMARQLSGDAEGARQAWTRSLELAPGQEGVEASLRRLDEVPR